MPVLKYVPEDRRNKKTLRLSRMRNNVNSQNGEDGILEALFKEIGAKNKWCVEFGAWDGVHLSNTCHLIREHGWNAVLIEGDKRKFAELTTNFGANDRCVLVKTMIGYERGSNTIDDVLASTNAPLDLDLISIDIDGNDWHIWDSITSYRPRVVVIEYNPTIPDDIVFYQDRDMQVNHGCSLAALVELGKSKRYELVALTNFNGIFVVSEDYEKCGIDDNSIHAFRVSPRGRIFCAYDGTIFQTLERMKWAGRDLVITPTSLQLLPPEKLNRYYKPKT